MLRLYLTPDSPLQPGTQKEAWDPGISHSPGHYEEVPSKTVQWAPTSGTSLLKDFIPPGPWAVTLTGEAEQEAEGH